MRTARLTAREVLETLRREGSVQGAARALRVGEQVVRLYAYTLASQGLIRIDRRTGRCDCSACPLKGLCGFTIPRRPQRPSG